MASSRVFVKGLPPTISEEEFRTHFSAQQAITDAKLIPHRRIGYVGYKTPEAAAKAVKYFNKSFIRMSKIGVELARPISDSTLPLSRKAQREQEKEKAILERRERLEETASTKLNAGQKRKRGDVEADPRLVEFLEIMRPASKPKTWDTQLVDNPTNESPTTAQTEVFTGEESDEEYEAVPEKLKTELMPEVPSGLVPAAREPVEPAEGENIVPDPMAPDATDDDWLRKRTNRLLDLIDPDDILAGKEASRSGGVNHVTETEVSEPTPDKSEELPPPAEEEWEGLEDERPDPVIDAIKSNGRLFVRNLPYSATEDDLREHFAPYGVLEEIHLPLDSEGASKGFLLVQYADPAAAANAYHNVDGEPFQGRLLHVLPAAGKRENKLDEFAIAKLPLKKQREIKKKQEASSMTFNWNSLFMSQDAVNSAIADRLGVSKHDLLDPTSADAGVRQALAETSVIQETKSYFIKNGVDLNAFKKRERGDTAILVKNFPYGMTLEELRKMFEEFGPVLRVLMPPTGTIAIVEMSQPGQAKAAFAGLAYRRIKDSVLFLEKGPKNLFIGPSIQSTLQHDDKNGDKLADPKLSASDLLEDRPVEIADTTTLFVRNLNFATTSSRLTDFFKPLDGFVSARVNTKKDPKKPDQVLSMGFGFLEFKSIAQAQAALATMDGRDLDGHKLVIKTSHKGTDAAEERRKEDRARKSASKRTKIVIKNLPFQASKKDVRALFGSYGQLRSVRVPKKFDHSTRGFAFADFVTAREAENALEALKDTHLLGRRLVLEFAASDPVDAEEQIEKMQKKVGSQVNKVALQKLTGGGRKKFNIEGDDAGED
ncbi:hypothetical protein OIDMADRAFT_129789 [Oidiodendron maius Zn]|uniref:Multiple RNA-binding domain-containing protein 1 n=1 Tax=Oidiodendron maius (strain Zn) TaxID=913774 RepID=A0A0C3H3K4_OIDMZ|nr:hypothetical protein OIDMADRAFT_129789 [Oidiodendron maius Zn]